MEKEREANAELRETIKRLEKEKDHAGQGQKEDEEKEDDAKDAPTAEYEDIMSP